MSRALFFIVAACATAQAGLLKGVDPILTPELLHVLRSMGHGDKLVIADVNFPAAEVATKTTSGKNIFLAGVDLPRALEAICSLLPIDYFVDAPAGHMAPQVGGTMPAAGEEVIASAAEVVGRHAAGITLQPIERFEFYDVARTAFAVVQTMERRPYGNVVLTKGVVGPDGKDLMP